MRGSTRSTIGVLILSSVLIFAGLELTSGLFLTYDTVYIPYEEPAVKVVSFYPNQTEYVEFSVPSYAIAPYFSFSYTAYSMEPRNIFTPNLSYIDVPSQVNVSIITSSSVVHYSGFSSNSHMGVALSPGTIYDLEFQGEPGSSGNLISVSFINVLHFYNTHFGKEFATAQKNVIYPLVNYSEPVISSLAKNNSSEAFIFTLPWFLQTVNLSIDLNAAPWSPVVLYLLSSEDTPLVVTGVVDVYSAYHLVSGGEAYMLNITVAKKYLEKSNPSVSVDVFANATYRSYWEYQPYFTYYTNQYYVPYGYPVPQP